MKLINVQSQSIHAVSTMCKSCCAHFHNQSGTCVAIRRDDVKTVFASNMQCNYYLLSEISFRTVSCICAEVAITIHTCLHRIAASDLQALHKCVITFLRFTQSRYKHCCLINATRCLKLAQKLKSQFSKKNVFDMRFDAKSFCSHRKPLLHFVQIGCESIMNASCIMHATRSMNLMNDYKKVVR